MTVRILLIEDDAEDANAFKVAIESQIEGSSIDVAYDVSAAIAVLTRDSTYDQIFWDPISQKTQDLAKAIADLSKFGIPVALTPSNPGLFASLQKRQISKSVQSVPLTEMGALIEMMKTLASKKSGGGTEQKVGLEVVKIKIGIIQERLGNLEKLREDDHNILIDLRNQMLFLSGQFRENSQKMGSWQQTTDTQISTLFNAVGDVEADEKIQIAQLDYRSKIFATLVQVVLPIVGAIATVGTAIGMTWFATHQEKLSPPKPENPSQEKATPLKPEKPKQGKLAK
jgi:hypothetical protein